MGGPFYCDGCGAVGFGAEMHICGAKKLCPRCAQGYSYLVRMGESTEAKPCACGRAMAMMGRDGCYLCPGCREAHERTLREREDSEEKGDFDAVSKPYHYNACGDVDDDGRAVYEPIKVIESWGWGYAFCMACAVKYILRAPHKGAGQKDLKKTLWYLERAHGSSGLPSRMPQEPMDPVETSEAWELSQDLAKALEAIYEDAPERAAYHVRAHLGTGAKERPEADSDLAAEFRANIEHKKKLFPWMSKKGDE